MSRPRSDRILSVTLSFAALLSGTIVLGILCFLLIEAWPSISSGKIAAFFVDKEWQPGSKREPGFGIYPMLLASVLVTAMAAVMAIPIGILSAVFRVYYSTGVLGQWQDRFLELLAGIPSVIFGFWGLTVIVPLINRFHPPGQSLLAAGIVLALMILPTIALTAKSALLSVDSSMVSGAAALGLSRPSLIIYILLPCAKGAILSGCVLGLARAIGETMAVVMVCGNIAQIPGSWFDPVRPVTATIALEMGYASADHKSLLYAAGLILIVLTGMLLIFRQAKETPY